MGKSVDLVGRQFGHLTAVAFSHRNGRRLGHWRCRCSCGEEVVVAQNNLCSGNSKSCGCGHGLSISDPITHEELLALVQYDPDTGFFTWKVAARNFRAGDQAGHWNEANPYVRISFRKRSYYAQVLAWFYMTKRWPINEIDHEDNDKINNKWLNLREATHVQNCYNRPHTVANELKLKGVRCIDGRYVARIVVNKQRHNLGWFNTAVEAAQAYDAAAIRLHGDFARTNFEPNP